MPVAISVEFSNILEKLHDLHSNVFQLESAYIALVKVSHHTWIKDYCRDKSN